MLSHPPAKVLLNTLLRPVQKDATKTARSSDMELIVMGYKQETHSQGLAVCRNTEAGTALGAVEVFQHHRTRPHVAQPSSSANAAGTCSLFTPDLGSVATVGTFPSKTPPS